MREREGENSPREEADKQAWLGTGTEAVCVSAAASPHSADCLTPLPPSLLALPLQWWLFNIQFHDVVPVQFVFYLLTSSDKQSIPPVVHIYSPRLSEN